ncbi:MAG: hypothetical protein KDA89_07495 [Planctomycetaceae bacterium]|nr:hypothetical protein [Planctomycetaceae bacterium]
MNHAWAAKLHASHRERLAQLRQIPGLRAAVDGDTIWVRGDDPSPEVLSVVKTIADSCLYTIVCSPDSIDPDNHEKEWLVPADRAVPTESLPRLDWEDPAVMVSLVLPIAAVPRTSRHSIDRTDSGAGTAITRIPISLIRASREQPLQLLLCRFRQLSDWCETASELRLSPCRFAVLTPRKRIDREPTSRPTDLRGNITGNDEPTDAFVSERRLGTNSAKHAAWPSEVSDVWQTSAIVAATSARSLPPLPGRRYYFRSGIALPAGWTWFPQVDEQTLRRVLDGSSRADNQQSPENCQPAAGSVFSDRDLLIWMPEEHEAAFLPLCVNDTSAATATEKNSERLTGTFVRVEDTAFAPLRRASVRALEAV